MSEHGLTKESLLLTFPVALQKDKTALALAEITARLLARRPEEIERLRIYPAIDQLDEPLLDILAYDFKVDWWDADYSLEEKRRTLKESWYVHKKLGTQGAVERAIRAIYPLTTVEPWFRYGEGDGQPYHFRLRIDITSDGGDRERQKRVLERLDYYKSLRDHLDAVKYFLLPEKAWAVAGGGFTGSRREERTVIVPPPLTPPGGQALARVYGAVSGVCRRLDGAVEVPALDRPGGTAYANTGGALGGTVQHMETARLSVPPLEQAGGSAQRVAGAVVCGTFRRTSVTVRGGGGVCRPAGRGGAGCSAGAFRNYQRMWISVGNPAGTI